MKPFKSFFRTIRSPERKLDFISKLPLEMSQLILRKLDPESLLRAAQVSRRWMNICRSDRRLKITARQYKKAKENFAESQRTSTSLSCTRNADANVRKNIGYCDLLDYVQCVGINQVQTPYIWDMKSGAPNFLECQHSSSGIDSGNMNVKRRRVSKTSCEETTEVDFIAKLPLENLCCAPQEYRINGWKFVVPTNISGEVRETTYSLWTSVQIALEVSRTTYISTTNADQ
ncbi:unnamed protein product, partial [Heterotrigona itama]